MDDRQFRRLLDFLGYSYEGYRRVRKGVKKRIRRQMRAMDCRGMDDYLARLAASREVRTACIRRLSVPISRFWRDRALWEALRDEELPALRQRFGDRLTAWSAGCACGEEAYSLAMADHESRITKASGDSVCLVLTATDLNPVVLARARSGIYPASSMREVPEELVGRYFVALRKRRRYRIRRELLGRIHWRRGSIERPAAAGPFHLILLRNNVLTYLDKQRQAHVLAHVTAQLHPGGLLAVGMREQLPGKAHDLRPVSARLPFVYIKTDASPAMPSKRAPL
jgi:chemotaxis methyl-accepting protein methylase